MDEQRIYKLLVSTNREDQIIGLHICYNQPLATSWISTVKYLLRKHGKHSEYERRWDDLFLLGIKVFY